MGAVRISHSSTRVAVLCIAAFFAGRFLHLSSLPSPATYRGQNEVGYKLFEISISVVSKNHN